MAGTAEKRDQVMSWEAVETLIARGRKIFIFEGMVLKVDSWIPYHPGGDKAILHMVGRDGTDEVSCMHPPEALARMRTYKIGRVEGHWKNFVPPIQGGVFRDHEELARSNDAKEREAATMKATAAAKTVEEYADDSSTASSRSQSPVFDQAHEAEKSGLRRRQAQISADVETSSVSSLSDVEDKDSRQPRMSHLDMITKEAIDLDLAKYPSLEPDSQENIRARYRILYQRLIDEGLFQCNYWQYGIECLRYGLLFGLFLFFLNSSTYYSPSLAGFFLGCTWHQLVFTAHDAGHMGITHNFTIDTTIGIVIGDFIGGVSLGWWKRSHNVHHIVTNSTRHDPDIQHLPFFAVSHDFFNSLYSTYHDRVMQFDNAFAQWFVERQAWLYYPVLCFGRFNLYVQSWVYLLGGQAPRRGPAWWTRWLEIAGQLVFMYWFWYLVVYHGLRTNGDRFALVMISHVVTMPLHAQITLSHFAMSTTDLGVGESFPQRMLRTTMDVDCPQWLDFFHGGLQFQAIHHLYPRIPRHNLRRAQKLVMEFCSDVGIPYALYGFVDGSKTVIGRLGEVGRQAAILAECQKTMANTGHWD